PSAIASVRGTSFSVEVPSLSRVFNRQYRDEFFQTRHLMSGLRGHLMSASIGLAMLQGLLTEAPGGRVPASVKVYEGRVLVMYPSYTGSIKQSWTLGAGQMVDTTRAELSTLASVTAQDYQNWNLPVPKTAPELAPAGSPHTIPPTGSDMPGDGQ